MTIYFRMAWSEVAETYKNLHLSIETLAKVVGISATIAVAVPLAQLGEERSGARRGNHPDYVTELTSLMSEMCIIAASLLTLAAIEDDPRRFYLHSATDKEFTADLSFRAAEDSANRAITLAICYLQSVMAFIEILESMNGFGLPEAGDEFCDGSEAFSKVIADILLNAFPTDWSGAAAEEYAQRNERQWNLVHDLAAADRAVASALAIQAGQVEQIRQGLAGAKQALLGAIITLAAWRTLILGEEFLEMYYSVVTQYAGRAGLAAAITVLGLVSTLVYESKENRKNFRATQRQYMDVGGGFAANSLPRLATSPNMVDIANNHSSYVAGAGDMQDRPFSASVPTDPRETPDALRFSGDWARQQRGQQGQRPAAGANRDDVAPNITENPDFIGSDFIGKDVALAAPIEASAEPASSIWAGANWGLQGGRLIEVAGGRGTVSSKD